MHLRSPSIHPSLHRSIDLLPVYSSVWIYLYLFVDQYIMFWYLSAFLYLSNLISLPCHPCIHLPSCLPLSCPIYLSSWVIETRSRRQCCGPKVCKVEIQKTYSFSFFLTVWTLFKARNRPWTIRCTCHMKPRPSTQLMDFTFAAAETAYLYCSLYHVVYAMYHVEIFPNVAFLKSETFGFSKSEKPKVVHHASPCSAHPQKFINFCGKLHPFQNWFRETLRHGRFVELSVQNVISTKAEASYIYLYAFLHCSQHVVWFARFLYSRVRWTT